MRSRRRVAAAVAVAVTCVAATSALPAPSAEPARRCPREMVDTGRVCIDRYEASMVDTTTGQPLSPYYPPDPVASRRVRLVWEVERRSVGDEAARDLALPDLPAWQRTHDFSPRAVSVSGAVPQAYVSHALAKAACAAAGKRLCAHDEWVHACRGASRRRFPYGAEWEAGRCNTNRARHPAAILHGSASLGLLDPRLNLVHEGAAPLLERTGARPACASAWRGDRAFDLVGNLDEWVDDEKPAFVGGFYARAGRKGCDARISSHAPAYFDYSTGARCCRDRRAARAR
ncbi:MAG: hypothetical protein IT376_09140 [Polyangiaceae bacterium]|nr:hypothetical protein [Polyangiaceae bacterium]